MSQCQGTQRKIQKGDINHYALGLVGLGDVFVLGDTTSKESDINLKKFNKSMISSLFEL